MLEIEKELVEISAQIEASIDHPDDVARPQIKPACVRFIKTLAQFTDNAQTANYIYNGISVAILGEANAGKSSLFNALLGHDRSIVTEIAGTTTDLVAETIQIGGFKVRLTDTAGINKNPRDKIEKMGIERTIRAAQNCDVAIIFDDSARAIIGDKPFIKVTRTTNVEEIKKGIITKAGMATGGKGFASGGFGWANKSIANLRQIAELRLAKAAIESAISAEQTDMAASDIQTALFHIGNITGTNATEAVLDEIFSKFCLGK